MKIKIGEKQQHKRTHIETFRKVKVYSDNFSETLTAGRQIKVGRLIEVRLY